MAKKLPSLSCSVCHDAIGPAVKVSPVFAEDGKGGNEPFCPACFVEVRAPKEPGRWPGIAPVKCSACGWSSTARGVARCPRCGCTRVRHPKSDKARPALVG